MLTPNDIECLREVAAAYLAHDCNASRAAVALNLPRKTLTGRLDLIRRLFPFLLPPGSPGGRPLFSHSPIDGPLPPADKPVVNPIDAREASDLASAQRRRIRELEGDLVEERNWRRKFESLQAARSEDVTWRPPVSRGKTALTPILFTSDFQCGEVIRPEEIDGINSYNMDIFADRYRLMIDKTIELATHHTGATEFPGCVYLRGGDAISGEIHEELSETNDLSSIPALKWLREHERAGIKRLKAKFGRVRVISIPGNHGRTTKKPHSKGYSERSYETLLSWWLADSFENDDKVTFFMPPSGDALFDVCGRKFLLSHGDRMGSRGGQGFIGPAATIARGHQKLMSNYALSGRHVDCVLTGHLHSSLKLSHGYANGSLAGYSEYARDFRAVPDAPKQWLLFAHAEMLVSHAFELQLGPQPRRTAEWEDAP